MSFKKNSVSLFEWCLILRSDVYSSCSLSFSQVKKSTLNPNAKEFNPIKAQMPMVSQFILFGSGKYRLLHCIETIMQKLVKDTAMS